MSTNEASLLESTFFDRIITRYDHFIPDPKIVDHEHEIRGANVEFEGPIALNTKALPAAQFVLLDTINDEVDVNEWMYQGELTSSVYNVLSASLGKKKNVISRRVSDLRNNGAVETLHSLKLYPRSLVIDLRMTDRGQEYYYNMIDKHPEQVQQLFIGKTITALAGEVRHAGAELGFREYEQQIVDQYKDDAEACVGALEKALEFLEDTINSRSARAA